MKTYCAILAALVAFAVATAPPCLAAEGVEVKPAQPKRAGKKPARKDPFGRATSTFGENLDQLKEKLDLSDEQKEKLGKLIETRDKALEKYDKVNEPKAQKIEGRLSQLQGKGAKNKQVQGMRRQLEGYLKNIQTGRQRITDACEKRMFALLTPEQRAKWNTPILQDELTKEFSLLFLDTKQEERLENLCKAQAKRLSVPLDPEKHAKALDGLKLQVYRSILNKKQQFEYRKMKATTTSKKGKGREGVRKGR
jgi:Spy/CpxP family protein refolding chaperone